MWRPLLRAGVVLGLGLAAGCAAHPVDRGGSFRGAVDSAPLPELLVVEPAELVPHLDSLVDPAEVEAALGPFLPGEVMLRGLEEQDCQCRAAAVASRAELLDAERAAVAVGRHGSAASRAASLQRRVLSLAAVEDRNRSAAAALELFFRLAEAQARAPLVASSLDELDGAIRDLKRFADQGLTLPPDSGGFARQRLALVQQQVELERTIDRLDGELKTLLALDRDGAESWRLAPLVDWTIAIEPVDLDAAIAEAKSSRAELAAIDAVAARLDEETLPAARTLMGGVNPLLGLAAIGGRPLRPALASLFAPSAKVEQEVSARRRQLADLRADRERAIEAEVRDGAAAMNAAVRNATIANQLVGLWIERIEELEARRATGGATPFDLTAARLELAKAQGDRLSRVADWKVAETRLRQALGRLAAECGYEVVHRGTMAGAAPESCEAAEVDNSHGH